ncbi:MAG: hypothetical protein Q8904_12835 [Bacteroidota bacterium]|nr:hypothetical protein [Bacteroidota bacterium]
MGNKYSFALILALLITSLKTAAQYKDIIPASPEAGALAKSINYPVSYNTGVPNINIPLYELKAGELTLPVNISYHAGGFKVNEQAGNVGLGWSLNTDLQVSVKINGLFDLTGNNGYINNNIINSFPGGYGVHDITNPSGGDAQNGDFMNHIKNYNTCWRIITGDLDLQPDEFYYKLLNKSGKFYFKPNGEIETVPSNGIKIKFMYGIPYTSPTNQFIITDTDGTVYTFGDGLSYENSRAIELADISYPPVISSWKCVSIISPSKADTVKFKYNLGESKYMFSFNNSIQFLSSLSMTFDNLYYGDLKHPGDAILSGKYWEGVNGLKSSYPLFTFANPKYLCDGRLDAGLNLIDINTGNWVNYPRDASYLNPLCRETQTLKLDVITYSGVKGNAATLTYGYQSNQSNQLSSIDISDGQSNHTINFIQSPKESYANKQDSRECNITYYLDSVKTSNNDKYAFNYYNKVVFSNHSVGSDAWGGVNQLTVDGMDNSVSTINSLPYAASFVSNNYGNTTSTQIGNWPNGVEVDVSKITDGLLESIIYPTGGLTVFEYGPNEYYDQYASQQKMAGGVRINNIKYYNYSGGSLVAEKIYKYGENESGNGFTKRPFNWSSNGILDGYYYTQQRKYLEFYNGGKNYSVPQEETKTTILPSSIIDMFYSDGSPIYYTQVTEYKNENGTLSGKTEYKYADLTDNCYFNNFLGGTNISYRKDNWDNGQLISETYYKKNSNGFDIIKSKTYEYDKYKKTEIPNIEVFQNNEYWDTNNQNLTPNPGYDDPGCVESYISANDFTFFDYGLPVGDMLLKDEVEKTWDGQNVITKTTNYFYDLLNSDVGYPNQLTRSETTLSNGKNQTTYFIYPQNYAAGTDFIDSLKNNYMLTSLIEKITTIDDKVIEGKLNTYLPDNTGHVAKTFELDPTLPLTLSNFHAIQNLQRPIFIQDPSYFEKYSLEYTNKRLVMMTPKDNIHTSYYWGYHNTYPMIKAENVSYSNLNAAVNTALSVVSKGSIDDLTFAVGDLLTEAQKTLFKNFITSLRNNSLLASGQLTIYTYSPLIGMSSQTDTKGMTTYYAYDEFQRLKSIKDQNGNIIKSFDYHYKQ